jgi:hypothetical protein
MASRFFIQRTSNYIAAYDEEDVNTDVSSAKASEVHVQSNNQDDGYSSESLDVSSKG